MSGFLREGGAGMIPTLLFGFLWVGTAALALLRPERRVPGRLASLALATFGAGLLGTCMGIVSTFRYAQTVRAAEQGTVALAGTAESLHCLVMALVLIVIGALLSWGATFRSSPAGVLERARPGAAA